MMPYCKKCGDWVTDCDCLEEFRKRIKEPMTPLNEVETQKESWEVEFDRVFKSKELVLFLGKEVKELLRPFISQALLSDRARLVEQVNQQMVPLLYDKTYTSDYRQGYEDAIVKVESIIKESR